MSYFSQIGIFGWDHLEPVILASILTNKAVLLMGDHGANKTEGCGAISAAVFGASKFVPYDTSLVQADDLMGYINPAALSEGRMEYISTPDAIWDATSCLLDEINRCNPFNAAKFFEIVRSRTINGRKTALQFVWAAVNPPDQYNTAHMDRAQVSRFVVLQVPSLSELSVENRRKVLEPRTRTAPGSIQALMARAAAAKVPVTQAQKIENISIKLAEELVKSGVKFSARQLVDLRNLLVNMDRVALCFPELQVTEGSMSLAILGLIPEITGLVRGSPADKNAVISKINVIIKGFKFSDPIMMASTLKELVSAKSKDTHGWASTAVERIMTEEFPQADIESAWDALRSRTDVEKSLVDTIRRALATKKANLRLIQSGTFGSTFVEAVEPVLREALDSFGGGPRKKAAAKSDATGAKVKGKVK